MSTTDLIPILLTVGDLICNLFCRIPQIVRIIKLKQSEAISITYWVFCILSCAFCITFYILTLNIPFLITAIINLGFNITVLALVLKYRKKEDKKDGE